MDTDDSFFLNGVRLIKTGTYSGYYQYESEKGNIQVKGYFSGSALKYFEVFFPDGHKGVFGYSANTLNKIHYPVVSMTDLKGNKISYSYLYYDNRYCIDKISYNGSSIEFKYTSRTDTILTYTGGLKITESKLLESISPKFDGKTLSTYKFSYSIQNSKSYLTQVDYTSNGQALNPLRFYYGEGITDNTFSGSTTRLVQWYKTDRPNSILVSRGKFDYDKGSDGMITLPNLPTYWHYYKPGGAFSHSKNIFVNKYTGSEKILLYGNLKDEWADSLPNLYTEKGYIDIICADLDGKQEDYIIKINNEVINNVDQVKFKIYKAKHYSGLLPELKLLYIRSYDFQTVYTDAAGNKSVQPKFYYPGDFNGDGKIDIMAISVHEPFGDTSRPSNCYIFDLLSDKKLFQGNVLPYKLEFVGDKQEDPYEASNNSDKLYIIDYDGDGKSDLCHINENGINIYTFDISGTTMIPRKVATDSGITKNLAKNRHILVGEFNGDGKTDLLLSPLWTDKNDSLWKMFMSNGLGLFQNKTIKGPKVEKPNTDSNEGYITQDINGDGTSDLLHYTETGVLVHFAQNNTIETSVSATVGGFSSSSSILVSTDINTHNNFTQLLSVKDGTITKYAFSRDDQKEGLLTGMINSFGVVQRNDYNYINDEGVLNEYYIKGSDAVYPYANILEPLPVLLQSETLMGGEIVDRDSYTYRNGVINRQGLGFCGFEKIIRTDRKGHTHTQTYNPYNFGILTSEVSPSSECQFNYSVSIQTNKIAKIRLISQSEKDLLKGINTEISYTNDNYGFPTKEIKSFSDGITVTTTNTYAHEANVQDGYNLGFITSNSVSVAMNGSVYTELKKILSYEARQPKEISSYINGNLIKNLAITYDAYGNKTLESERLYSSTELLKTSYNYDSYGRLLKIADPLGLSTEYTYNSLGQQASEKDFRGQATTFEYDAFGRQTTANYPDNTVATSQYKWSAEGGTALLSVTKEKTGQPTETVVYDALGHEISSRLNRFDNSIQKVDQVYDYAGNVLKKSLPYTGNSPSLWTTYSYDDYERLLSVTEPSGRKTTHRYNHNSITTTTDNISTTRDYDALGNIISVTDPGGTIYYNLNADGQPESIVAPGEISTTFTYDVYRRRTKLTDPSAGTTTFEYDKKGNVTKTTNANGKSIQNEYDAYNRIIKKTTPELVTTYKYNSYGDMVEMKSDNGSKKGFAFDEYGRLKTEIELSAGGIGLTREYTYSNGNLISKRYAGNNGTLAAETYQYTNGHLSKITLNGTTVIFDLIEENDFGLPTKVLTGPVSRLYQYNSYGLPSGRRAFYGTRVYQNMSYTFNSTTRCLLTRVDGTRNITEAFKYDELNRLTSYGAAGLRFTSAYDDKGNITAKSDVGNFAYSLAQKPYAISGVGLTTSAVPLRNQEVSYTSFGRPSVISENGYKAKFYYNGDDDRSLMEVLSDDNILQTTNYLGGCYEVQETPSSTTERLYLAGDYYSSPVVLVKTAGISTLVYIIRDYLGSITQTVSGTNGTLIQETSYDAWGRMRNPATQQYYNPDVAPQLYLGRGYTGHEHLPWFGLVNMNARLYDPAVGRFLSPDPFIQMPDFSQNFNRYSYCLNNPLSNNDTDGQFVNSIVNGVIDLFDNLIRHGINVSQYNWNSTKNSWRIDMGWFKGDFKQILSRFTWEFPQTLCGYLAGTAQNYARGVKSVSYFGGATAIEYYNSHWGAFTLGSFINGQRDLEANSKNWLFQHEYGHYLQSQAYGWMYMQLYAIPSVIDAGRKKKGHDFHPIEQDANVRALRYFVKHVDGFINPTTGRVDSWDFSNNPIDGYDKFRRFSSQINQDALSSHTLRPEWWDYRFLSPFPHIIPIVWNIIDLNL